MIVAYDIDGSVLWNTDYLGKEEFITSIKKFNEHPPLSTIVRSTENGAFFIRSRNVTIHWVKKNRGDFILNYVCSPFL